MQAIPAFCVMDKVLCQGVFSIIIEFKVFGNQGFKVKGGIIYFTLAKVLRIGKGGYISYDEGENEQAYGHGHGVYV